MRQVFRCSRTSDLWNDFSRTRHTSCQKMFGKTADMFVRISWKHRRLWRHLGSHLFHSVHYLSCVNIVTPAALTMLIHYPLFPGTQNKDTSQMITITLQITSSAQLFGPIDVQPGLYSQKAPQAHLSDLWPIESPLTVKEHPLSLEEFCLKFIGTQSLPHNSIHWHSQLGETRLQGSQSQRLIPAQLSSRPSYCHNHCSVFSP